MRWTVAGVIAGMMLVAPAATLQTPAPTTTNAQYAQLAGQVLDAVSGRPIGAARVEIPHLGRWAQADSNGAFRLADVPPGSQQLVVRAIGYAPVHVMLQFAASGSLDTEVVLAPVTTTLGTVRVEAAFEERYARQLRQFEESRSFGVGRFLDWRYFNDNQNTNVAMLLGGRFGGLRVGSSGKGSSARELMVTRDGFPCKPQTYVNGLRWEEGVNLDGINTADILGFEFYTPATTPSRYNVTGSRERNAACGTVVFWLK